jgi:hypothetical protein
MMEESDGRFKCSYGILPQIASVLMSGTAVEQNV